MQRNLEFGQVELVSSVKLSLIIPIHNVKCAFLYTIVQYNNAKETEYMYLTVHYNEDKMHLQKNVANSLCMYATGRQ